MPYSITRIQWVKSLSHLNHHMSHEDVNPFIISVMTISSCQIQPHRDDIWKWKCLDSFLSSILITQSAMRNGCWDLRRSGPLINIKTVFPGKGIAIIKKVGMKTQLLSLWSFISKLTSHWLGLSIRSHVRRTFLNNSTSLNTGIFTWWCHRLPQILVIID